MLRNLNFPPAAGKRVLGTPKTGVPGSLIPQGGQNGGSFLYPSLSLPADASKEIRGWVTSRPASGVLRTFENGAYEFDPQGASGEFAFSFQLYVNGVLTGPLATVSLSIGLPSSTVTGVTVTPATASVAGGATQAFSALVLGSGSPSQSVTWTVSGGGAISPAGLFTAPAATGAAQTVTITARSVQNPAFAATATVTVPAVIQTPQIAFTAVLPDGSPASNITGLRWAFFDQNTPDALLAPSAKGSGKSTDSSGKLVIVLSGSTLAAGQTGYLLLSNTNGAASQLPAPFVFAGPVVVQ